MELTQAATTLERGQGEKTRYVVCGLSRRAIVMFILPLIGSRQIAGEDYSGCGDVVGVLDADVARIEAFNQKHGTALPAYDAENFDGMVADTSPDTVIVSGPDWTHAGYIVRALEHGLDVITEKPMARDCKQARAVIEAETKSRGSVRVAFNARYMEGHRTVKRMLLNGLVGRITNIEFTHNLDTFHGASFFERWNRDREFSGGMSVTKAVHDFDLINWFLEDRPEQVFAFGALNYYGADSPYKPRTPDGAHYSVEDQRRRCPYYRRWHGIGLAEPEPEPLLALNALPFTVQYSTENPIYIYDDEIDIEDTYSAVVRYAGGASMTYSTNFSAPWEGYTLGINGTKGRIEAASYDAPARCPFPVTKPQTVTYYPLFGERQIHEIRQAAGGHAGADPLLRRDLFAPEPDGDSRELALAAGSLEGAYAVAVGEATWRSVSENRPIDVAPLLFGDSAIG